MQNYAKLGGVLSIVAGAIGVLWLFMIIIFACISVLVFYEDDVFSMPGMTGGEWAFFVVIYAGMGLFYAVIGALGIIGGILAIRKKHWGWALAGAIAGTITFLPCGVPALIFVAMGRPEFSAPPPPAPAAVRGNM